MALFAVGVLAVVGGSPTFAQSVGAPSTLPPRTNAPLPALPTEVPTLGPGQAGLSGAIRAVGWLEVRLVVPRACALATNGGSNMSVECRSETPYLLTALNDADMEFDETADLAFRSHVVTKTAFFQVPIHAQRMTVDY